MTQSMLFSCSSCGRDTLTQSHALSCPVFQKRVVDETRAKCKDLGIPFPEDRYQLPLKLGPI